MKIFRKGARLEKAAAGLVSRLESDLDRLEKPDILSPEEIEALTPDRFEMAEFSEKAAESAGYSNYSYWRCTFQAFWRNKVARVLLILLAALIVFTVLQPYLPGQKDPEAIFNIVNADGKTVPSRDVRPGAEYWLGTDSAGHDMWARIWAGTRTSLLLALIVASFNCLVGITVGVLWGYVRKLDAFLTEVYNVMDNIPRTIILILMSYIMRPGMSTMIVSMCVVGWLPTTRFIRNQVIMIRDRDYNLASRCLGTPTKRIMLRNLLPYLVSVIMLQTALAIPSVISDEVFLTYCGLGMPTAQASLGNLVEAGRKVMMSPSTRYQLIYPALMVSFITVSFYLIGNAFADAADPRNHV